VHNSLVQNQATASLPSYLLAGNSWQQQGQIALTNPHCFFSFFSFSLSLNSLLPGSVKLKHSAENGRDLHTFGRTWTCHDMCVHRTSDCPPTVQISLCLSVSATLPTIMQHREAHKESCKHLGRPGPTKHKQAQNLCLLPTCTAL
jgi:hypothetical protein